MSPTIYREGNARFLFFSREEKRMHVHIVSPEGEAKFWLEPEVSLADSYGFSNSELTKFKKLVDNKKNEFIEKWNEHFKS